MASKTQKIPQESWDHHKETILSLYLTSDLSVDELVQAMDKDHGFNATLSQFEAQLRVWNARKNLKRHEWDVILQKLDHLLSRDIQARVVISGHPVSVDRVHRARRHCKSGPPRKRPRIEIDPYLNANNIDGSVAIEVQDPNGNWTLYTDLVDEDAVPDIQQTGVGDIHGPITHEGIDGNEDARSSLGRSGNSNNSHLGITEPSTSSTMSLGLPSFHTRGVISHSQLSDHDEENPVRTVDFLGQPVQSQELQEDTSFTALDLGNPSSQSGDLALLPWGTFHLGGLPFERFEGALSSRGLELIIRPSMIQGLRLLFESPKLVPIFLTNVAATMTNSNGKPVNANIYDAGLTLQTLDTILPLSQERCGNDSMSRPSHEMLDVELCRILLFSTANGFMGTEGVPIETILAFLNQNSNITTLLWRLFRDKPSHVAKSLAENLFRATIETGDHRTISLLLKTGLIDVNKTVCYVDGEKYTPIERVAKLQKLEAVRELLSFKPNVNSTFPKYCEEDGKDEYQIGYQRLLSEYGHRGALGCLIKGLCPDDPGKRNHIAFSQEYLDTVDYLIREGAEVRVWFIRVALMDFVRMDLAEKLLQNLQPENHALAISINVLNIIAHNLIDKKAEEFITKILTDCERTGCRQCLTKYPETINWAIVVGAKRGHLQLVRACFKYAKYPAQILAASITSGNHELVKFVLAQNPDMHAPAADIITPPWTRSDIDDRPVTTPIAAAINAGDWTLVRELEAKGAFEHLDTGNRLLPTLSAIAGAGEIEYMRKLLFLYPQLNGRDMEDALLSAATNKKEDVLRLLLDAGAQPMINLNSHNYHNTMKILVQVYKWGNDSLYSELMSAYKDLVVDSHSIEHLKLMENINLFDFVFQSGVFGIMELGQVSKIAAEKGDRALLRRCLELGADVLAVDVLCAAAKGHPDILRIVFEYIPLTKTCVRHFGTLALVEAIRGNPNNTEALELFIACKAVDFRSTISLRPRYLEDQYSSVKYAPLGIAIEKDTENCHLIFPLTTRLLDSGCDVDSIVETDYDKYKRRWNKTPLLQAIKTRSMGLVQLLIERGAHVNKEAVWGIRRTPIQAAAEIGSLDIVKLLLQNGANVNTSPAQFDGRTALQCAAMSGNCNIAALLLDNGADIFAPPAPFGGQWPIEAAAEHGRIEMIQYVWNASYGQVPLEQCRKAMELAKENGHGACADLIRELAVTNGIMPTLEGSE